MATTAPETQKPTRTTSAGARLDALTSLRFFAAFTIVVHHSRGTFLPPNFLINWPLDQAVSLFFVLSGFILFHVYPELPNKQAVAQFWIARVARIWPAHLVALVLLMIIAYQHLELVLGLHSPTILIANLLLVQAWLPLRDFYFSFNSLSWTISTELAFYLLFPALIYRFKSTWGWKLLGAAALLVGLMIFCTVWQIRDYSDEYNGVTTLGLLYISPLARLFEFVLGMCAALWWHRLRPSIGSSRLAWSITEVAAIGFALWSVRYGVIEVSRLVQPNPVVLLWMVKASSCFAFSLLIAVMASGTGLIGRCLCLPFFVFLGEISYAVYMLHQILITGYGFHLNLIPEMPTALRWPVFVVVLLLASTLTNLLVEQPLRAKIRTLGTFWRREPRLASASIQPSKINPPLD